MAVEIERKYLVHQKLWLALKEKLSGTLIQQGYLSRIAERTVRIRIRGEQAFLTIKGKNKGITRSEFEYPIPVEDAVEMLKICDGAIIEKTRYLLPINNVTWEIDEFYGDNTGLILAEVELENEQQKVALPNWIGEEVSNDTRYYNACLIGHPYKHWKE
jgi:adenylate cyclase